MQIVADPLLVVLLLVNFFMLGTSRLRALINGSAAQGVLLALLVVAVHGEVTLQATTREIEPVIGFVPSLLLGGLGTGLSVVFARTLPLAPEHVGSLLVPASLATAFTGFLLLATRRKAITQVVGYLALENGVFVMGLTLVEAMPLLVETGVLLDLVVAIFVMGIIIEHISREFSSIDTTRLSSLKE